MFPSGDQDAQQILAQAAMGTFTPGLEIVRFRKRYYIRYHQYDSDYEGLGAHIVARIPTDPAKYQKWLESMRNHYASTEHKLEDQVYEVPNGPEPDERDHEFKELPTELPNRLDHWVFEFSYIINLDSEVLTMNNSIHWKLDSIPRQRDLWMEAISDSIYLGKPTISLDICSEEHMASPALTLPEPDPVIPFDVCLASPNINIKGAWSAFLTHALAKILKTYSPQIINFGREWSADSFPFRELMFALVSVASNQAKFHDHRGQQCQRQCCRSDRSLTPSPVEDEWVGDSVPLHFGSMSHRPGKPPGASPTEIIYWVGGVLVSLELVLDGKAVTKVVDWAVQQGHVNFQVVILSLFEAVFAEVSVGDGKKPFVKVSNTVDLSPLRAEYCVSTHPRERPALKDGMHARPQHGEKVIQSNCTATPASLEEHFPGLAALVNFFDAAATRRAAIKSPGSLPSELYERILDFVDYDTWKACLMVSTEFRFYCLRKYRLDPVHRLVAGPFVRVSRRPTTHLSFDVENLQTGTVVPMMHHQTRGPTGECSWIPIIGDERKAIMTNVTISFGQVGDLPIVDSSDEGN
ncbi:hypothetical protein JDV02_004702 [Purpureocillium takamizusanense]|uniref:F-box domain-containing protein n=1 Tax=Purpureocillium takamizusanense TaxID=2060973 RepID=A0A9Q8QF74_9HYPO|nr:uncharacterized protein JDV02_004702 [Purpureocillium takamizusanense]UNI18433.1 hypothetical protein JDV02_004702 [Purpureocillium takamizusanense]